MTKRTREMPREFRSYSTRDAIRVAAERICGESGATQVKLREIARRVGLEPASIYSYYSGLDDILAAAVKDALEDIYNRLDGVDTTTLESTVRSLCLIETRFQAERRGIARLLLIDLATIEGNAAFNANEDLIVSLNRREIELIERHVDLGPLDRAARNDIVLARLGMILTMLAFRWQQRLGVTEADVVHIADVAASNMLGHLGNLSEER